MVPQKLFLLHSQSSQHPSNAISLAGSRPDFDDVTHTIHLQASSLTAVLFDALLFGLGRAGTSLPFDLPSFQGAYCLHKQPLNGLCICKRLGSCHV